MKKITDFVREKYSLETTSSKGVRLPKFRIYGGESFRINRLWKINGFKNIAYLISYRTLYDAEISGTGGMSYLTDQNHENHTTIILQLSSPIPDLIIRPRKLVDFLTDPLFRNGKKLNRNLRFNLKYIIELDRDSDQLELLNNQEIISKLLELNHFWVEFLDNHITFHFQNGRTLDNFLKIQEVAELFVDQIKNVA